MVRVLSIADPEVTASSAEPRDGSCRGGIGALIGGLRWLLWAGALPVLLGCAAANSTPSSPPPMSRHRPIAPAVPVGTARASSGAAALPAAVDRSEARAALDPDAETIPARDPIDVLATPSAPPTTSRHPFEDPLPEEGLAAGSSAMRNANLSPGACRDEAQHRKLPFRRDRRPTPGVATAFRLTGPIGEVQYLSGGWSTPYGVLDCRLALTLDDLTAVLVRHGVVRVQLGTVYRPASKLHNGKLSQHAHGLAADVLAFGLRDGTWLEIERDWQGQIGEPPCGSGSRVEPASDAGIALRNLVCDIARNGYFHYILTPNHDAPHHDHVHLDIKRGADRTVAR